jgi:hypothetical protein
MLGVAAVLGDIRQVAAVGNLHLLLWLVGRRVARMQGMRKGVGLQGRRLAQAGRGAAKQHLVMTATEMLLWMRTKSSSSRRRRSRSSSLLSGAKELLRVLQLARRQQQRVQKPLQLLAVVADRPGRQGVDPCIVSAAFD